MMLAPPSSSRPYDDSPVHRPSLVPFCPSDVTSASFPDRPFLVTVGASCSLHLYDPTDLTPLFRLALLPEKEMGVSRRGADGVFTKFWEEGKKKLKKKSLPWFGPARGRGVRGSHHQRVANDCECVVAFGGTNAAGDESSSFPMKIAYGVARTGVVVCDLSEEIELLQRHLDLTDVRSAAARLPRPPPPYSALTGAVRSISSMRYLCRRSQASSSDELTLMKNSPVPVGERLVDAAVGKAYMQAEWDLLASDEAMEVSGEKGMRRSSRHTKFPGRKTLSSLVPHKGIIRAMAPIVDDPERPLMLSSNWGTGAWIWDVTSGEKLLDLSTSQPQSLISFPWRAAYSTVWKQAVLAGCDYYVVFYDPVTGAQPLCLQGHNGHVNGLALCDRENVIVTGSLDNSVRVWDHRTSRCVSKKEGVGRVQCLSNVGETHLFVAGEDHGHVFVMDRRSMDDVVVDFHVAPRGNIWELTPGIEEGQFISVTQTPVDFLHRWDTTGKIHSFGGIAVRSALGGIDTGKDPQTSTDGVCIWRGSGDSGLVRTAQEQDEVIAFVQEVIEVPNLRVRYEDGSVLSLWKCVACG